MSLETVTPRQRAARVNGALAKYRVGFRKHPETPIGFAIRRLLPGARSHRAIEALFGDQIPYSTIRNWRYGSRPIPRAAFDALLGQLEPIVQELKSKRPAD